MRIEGSIVKKKKRVLLLAVSCKLGGLCPGGLDLENPSRWIRIVADDDRGGSVQGKDIDFAKPLDVIEFEGRPMPQGKQKENWVIDSNSCRVIERKEIGIIHWAYEHYSYHGYWGNFRSYLNEEEFETIAEPSESILKVSNVRIYRNDYGSAKIDFEWAGARFPLKGVSMTDQDFYDAIKNSDVFIDQAYIVISIPKDIGDWVNPNTGEKQAYKFVSRIFKL